MLQLITILSIDEWINDVANKMSEKWKNSCHKFLKSKVFSSNVLFCLSNNPKSEDLPTYESKKIR